MTRVDFYVLPTAARQETLRWVCRLVEKAFKEGYKILLRPRDPIEGKQLEELLWTFRPGSFIPHAWLEQAPSEPPCLRVWLGQELPATFEVDLVINLADDPPLRWESVSRIAEVIDQGHVETGRRRYRLYQRKDAELHTHKMGRL